MSKIDTHQLMILISFQSVKLTGQARAKYNRTGIPGVFYKQVNSCLTGTLPAGSPVQTMFRNLNVVQTSCISHAIVFI